jgi:uncharacterized membrane protein YbaN (DUF454 family)
MFAKMQKQKTGWLFETQWTGKGSENAKEQEALPSNPNCGCTMIWYGGQ